MSTEAEPVVKGTLIDGRYEIRERLGQGGMGTVYRALDKKLGQTVALKMLLNSNSGSERSREERRRRFMHEIYAINEVAHRNVVHIQEFGFFKDTPYMVMELLKGKDLSRVLRESAGPLPIDYCVDVLLVVIAAIHACHEKGIIHRDLKPGNIMVIDADSGPGWDVKVVDFSISKLASELTRDGQIIGTPNYLSPEQINGKALPASDQYALGLLLYVCLTNRHPFEGLDGLPLIRAIERGELRKPRAYRADIPEELEQIIAKAMHLDPAQRYATVHEFGRMLWPFGSQLGKGVWKKYYIETPPVARPRTDPKASTTGIPLVLQIAQGKVPMSAATILAHYQSTTAVKVGTTTVDDPAARAAAEADPGVSAAAAKTTSSTVDDPEARQLGFLGAGAPSGAESNEAAGRSQPDGAESARARRPAKRRLGAIAAGAVALAAVGALAMMVARRPASGSQAKAKSAVTETPAAATSPMTAPLPTPPPPQAASAAPPSNTVADVAAAKRSGDPAERPEHPKRHQHDHARRKPAKTADWATDPFGNPIPPP